MQQRQRNVTNFLNTFCDDVEEEDGTIFLNWFSYSPEGNNPNRKGKHVTLENIVFGPIVLDIVEDMFYNIFCTTLKEMALTDLRLSTGCQQQCLK